MRKLACTAQAHGPKLSIVTRDSIRLSRVWKRDETEEAECCGVRLLAYPNQVNYITYEDHHHVYTQAMF